MEIELVFLKQSIFSHGRYGAQVIHFSSDIASSLIEISGMIVIILR